MHYNCKYRFPLEFISFSKLFNPEYYSTLDRMPSHMFYAFAVNLMPFQNGFPKLKLNTLEPDSANNKTSKYIVYLVYSTYIYFNAHLKSIVALYFHRQINLGI